MSQTRQRIRFLRASDGAQLAWAEAGEGPLLVKASNWMTHLEFEWQSPVWRHWMHFFSRHFRFVRYDERGCGLSDREPPTLSAERWSSDFEEVCDVVGTPEPFTILGISQGSLACIHYAVRHPERVSRMILYGGYARGFTRRSNGDAAREYRAIVEAVRVGWGKDNPAFRQLFTSRFIPEGTAEQVSWFNELCRKTVAPAMAADLLQLRGDVYIVDLLAQVRVPTLVIHAAEDNVIAATEGRLLASSIPGAQFVELESKNHILLEHEPAWTRFQEAVLEFTRAAPGGRTDDAFAALSPRERDVLALLSDGLDNVQIGERLSISEKTVRNHVSRIYDKLGVWTRAQAVVFAREHGFRR
ncbi:MAG TPA: alpha/beta fold hydrolase [Thermoanaerobaculia bacterium]|jgi:pimeloyl-ACP methyl ester carboxylesterase/DNA-binding CsgD family transcriptional regulator|nr:alpha/beta fold hydrolase [Thermoanaerobaculia bacterium]